jgi:hypothetical protein
MEKQEGHSHISFPAYRPKDVPGALAHNSPWYRTPSIGSNEQG